MTNEWSNAFAYAKNVLRRFGEATSTHPLIAVNDNDKIQILRDLDDQYKVRNLWRKVQVNTDFRSDPWDYSKHGVLLPLVLEIDVEGLPIAPDPETAWLVSRVFEKFIKKARGKSKSYNETLFHKISDFNFDITEHAAYRELGSINSDKAEQIVHDLNPALVTPLNALQAIMGETYARNWFSKPGPLPAALLDFIGGFYTTKSISADRIMSVSTRFPNDHPRDKVYTLYSSPDKHPQQHILYHGTGSDVLVKALPEIAESLDLPEGLKRAWYTVGIAGFINEDLELTAAWANRDPDDAVALPSGPAIAGRQNLYTEFHDYLASLPRQRWPNKALSIAYKALIRAVVKFPYEVEPYPSVYGTSVVRNTFEIYKYLLSEEDVDTITGVSTGSTLLCGLINTLSGIKSKANIVKTAENIPYSSINSLAAAQRKYLRAALPFCAEPLDLYLMAIDTIDEMQDTLIVNIEQAVDAIIASASQEDLLQLGDLSHYQGHDFIVYFPKNTTEPGKDLATITLGGYNLNYGKSAKQELAKLADGKRGKFSKYKADEIELFYINQYRKREDVFKYYNIDTAASWLARDDWYNLISPALVSLGKLKTHDVPDTKHVEPEKVINLIKELSKLRDAGILSDEEFLAEKSKLLGRLRRYR